MNTTQIAAASTALDSTRLYTQISLAVMKKGLDVAETAGEALEEMIDVAAAPPADGRLLDTYA
mgnify:CR=1 FL=1